MSFFLSVYFFSPIQQRKVRTKLSPGFRFLVAWRAFGASVAGWRVCTALPSCALNEPTREGWRLGMRVCNSSQRMCLCGNCGHTCGKPWQVKVRPAKTKESVINPQLLGPHFRLALLNNYHISPLLTVLCAFNVVCSVSVRFCMCMQMLVKCHWQQIRKYVVGLDVPGACWGSCNKRIWK